MRTLPILRLSLLIAVLTGLNGCDLLDYHPYDGRFSGAKDINARNIGRIETATRGRDSLVFAVITDTQRWYDETHDAVNSINARPEIDFVIHCGDLTDFSATREFEWMRDELERLAVPYVCLIGNHDCLANGPRVFQTMFGTPNFSFDAGDTHFICLDTNALEHDYSVPIPDFAFINADLQALPSTTRRTIAAMHACPYSDQFNNNIAPQFHEKMQTYPDLQFAVCGHQHATTVIEPYGDGFKYYQCGAAKGRKYLIFTLKKDGGYHREVIDY